MSGFINTVKEIFYGDRYFKEHVMPPDFDYRAHKKELSPYFERRGFKVSMMYNEFYSRYNGIRSDRYASMDLVYFYMFPCLCRHDMMTAYTDKNFFSYLYPDIRQPETVVKCRNGVFYDEDDRVVERKAALQICGNESEKCVIKPTVETCNGDGVSLKSFADENVADQIFRAYGDNFIVQRRLVSHPDLSFFSPGSFNTYRILTYRDVDKKVHWMDTISHLRIGGGGEEIKDNLSAGGLACPISKDGILSDQFTIYKSLEIGSMQKRYGIANYRVPSFDRAVRFALDLHERLPFFDFIGWDIGVLPDGNPVFIEYNLVPGIEGPQSIGGPLFGEYLDEVMDRVAAVRKLDVAASVNVFRPGFDHWQQIAGPEYRMR